MVSIEAMAISLTMLPLPLLGVVAVGVGELV